MRQGLCFAFHLTLRENKFEKNLSIMSDWEDDDAPPEGFRGNSEKVVQNNTYSNSRDSRTNNNFQRRKYNNPALTEYITIQIGTKDIGKLIGRGGSNIRELRDATGCQVIRYY